MEGWRNPWRTLESSWTSERLRFLVFVSLFFFPRLLPASSSLCYRYLVSTSGSSYVHGTWCLLSVPHDWCFCFRSLVSASVPIIRVYSAPVIRMSCSGSLFLLLVPLVCFCSGSSCLLLLLWSLFLLPVRRVRLRLDYFGLLMVPCVCFWSFCPLLGSPGHFLFSASTSGASDLHLVFLVAVLGSLCLDTVPRVCFRSFFCLQQVSCVLAGPGVSFWTAM